MKKKNKVMYMHTINDEPARYEEGEQIYHVNKYGDFIAKLVPTLRQIRKEQRLSDKWREERDGLLDTEYDYIRVEIPSLKTKRVKPSKAFGSMGAIMLCGGGI